MTLSKNFKQRLAFSGLGIIITLFVLFFSHHTYLKLLFGLFIATIIATTVWEFYRIAKSKGFHPLAPLGISGTVIYLLALFFRTEYPQLEILPDVVLALTLLMAFGYYFLKGSDPFVNLAITFFAFVYLTIPLACAIDINYFKFNDAFQDGRWWLLYAITVTKMTDIGAYFFGKQFGTKKMVPYISPKKTWEGALGGVFGALAASLVFFGFSFFSENSFPLSLSLAQSLGLGVLISFLAQFGDLAESLLKRDVGIKDSNQLPGLGGMLDIFDSLVFTLPLVYIFLKIAN